MLKKFVLLAIAGMFAAASGGAMAADGPFGVAMGTPASKLKFVHDFGEGYYALDSVPKPHSHFERYDVMIHEKTGVCLLRAVGIDIPTGGDGAALKDEFHFIAEQVKSVYGNYDVYEALDDGSKYSKPKDYMKAIVAEEMTLQGSWDEESHANLRNGVVEILLLGRATDKRTGYVVLQYRFANWRRCMDLVEAEASTDTF